jgi:hypothetical protein
VANDQNQDQGCGALIGLAGLDPRSLHRFVIGRDPAPVAMSVAQVNSDLDDPFAALLAGGTFPRTAIEVVDELKRALGTPRGIERSFLLGEGSQIPAAELPFGRRTMRFVIALGDPLVDVLVSSVAPASRSVEIMAWDATATGFNYYRTTRTGAWVLGGNSVDAVREDTEGKGPFESHTSGSVVMKELRFPWVHWHSFKARVDPAIFAGIQGLAGHRWVRPRGSGDGTLAGADVCELEVAMPSIRRWTAARFEAIGAGAEPPRPRRVFEQVLTSPTVNLVSSTTARSEAERGAPIDLPQQFFADSEALGDPEFLGLRKPPTLAVPADAYLAVMQEFGVRLEDGNGFTQQGDTHFAFVVPERAFEDIETAKAAVGLLLTERLAACLLMVDFPNPVFSARRERLLEHVPSDGDLSAGAEAFAEKVAAEVLANASNGSPEAEFKELWDAGDGWPDASNQRLQAYYDALERRLSDEPLEAFRDWFRLAEATRRHAANVEMMPIFEFPLLLARSDAADEPLAMRSDATVGSPAVA